jgi:hypothetical protein
MLGLMSVKALLGLKHVPPIPICWNDFGRLGVWITRTVKLSLEHRKAIVVRLKSPLENSISVQQKMLGSYCSSNCSCKPDQGPVKSLLHNSLYQASIKNCKSHDLQNLEKRYIQVLLTRGPMNFLFQTLGLRIRTI